MGGLAAAPAVLTACGREKKAKGRKPYNADIKLGFSQLGAESAWRTANTASIVQAAPPQGVNLTLLNAQGKQENQFAAIRSFIESKMDVVAFSPVVETGWEEILNEVKQAGIPVIVTDRLIDSDDTSLYISSIGADFHGEGGMAGTWLANNILNANEPVNVVEIRGAERTAPAIQRSAGFRQAVEDNQLLRIIGSEPSDWTIAGGKSAMRGFLSKHRHIDAVFAHNDDMGIGAMSAIEELDRRPGQDIKLITIDASKQGMKALVAGKINYIIECSPLIGPPLMDIVVDVYLGIRVPQRVFTDMKGYGPAEAKDALPDRVY